MKNTFYGASVVSISATEVPSPLRNLTTVIKNALSPSSTIQKHDEQETFEWLANEIHLVGV